MHRIGESPAHYFVFAKWDPNRNINITEFETQCVHVVHKMTEYQNPLSYRMALSILYIFDLPLLSCPCLSVYVFFLYLVASVSIRIYDLHLFVLQHCTVLFPCTQNKIKTQFVRVCLLLIFVSRSLCLSIYLYISLSISSHLEA